MINVIRYALIHQRSVLDKMVMKLSEGQLDCRPKEGLRSPRELYKHIFQMALAYSMAIRDGEGKADHLELIDMSPVALHKDLLEYGTQVSEIVIKAVEEMSEEDIGKIYSFRQWGDFKLEGRAALGTISDEMAHHKGQLTVYLRLLDIEPPFLYDFSQ